MDPNLPISGWSGDHAEGHPGTVGVPGISTWESHCPGRYKLIDQIARGGMGVVFRARDVTTGRLVALKFILSGVLASSVELERFRTEALACSKLDHPNIVTVYEVGAHSGQAYLCMKLVEGSDLAQRLRTGKLSPRESAKLIAQVASAVHHAHSREVIHRDLKPSNILVDAKGVPFLTDFGLAKLLERQQSLTVSGAAIGTPNYMAPEQFIHGGAAASTYSDVFSLGAILYHLLAGRAPFHGDTPGATFENLRNGEAPRLSLMSPTVDKDLEAICHKAIEREPKHRYASADDLKKDLEKWLNGQPIEARRISQAERALKWAKRRPVVAALSAVLALTVIVSTLLGIAAYRTVGYERDEAKRARRNEQAQLAEGLLREGNALAAVGRWRDAQDRLQKARERFSDLDESGLAADMALLAVENASPPPLLTLSAPGKQLTSVAVGMDKRNIWAGDREGLIHGWRLPLGEELSPVQAHARGVTALCASRVDALLFSGGGDGAIRIWRTNSLVPALTWAAHRGGVCSLALNPSHDRLISSGEDGVVRVWAVVNGEKLWEVNPNQGPLTSADYFTRTNLILIVSRSQGWSMTREGGMNADRYDYWLKNLRAAPLYQNFCRAQENGEIQTALLSGAPPPLTLLGKVDAPPTSILADTAYVQTIFVGAENGTISVWSDVPRAVFDEHTKAVTAMAPFPDWGHIASASLDGTVRIWPSARASERAPAALVGVEDMIAARSLYAAVDTNVLISGGDDGVFRVTDLNTGKALRKVNAHEASIRGVAASTNGSRIATASLDGNVWLWEGETMVTVRKLLGGRPFGCVAINDQGNLVAAGEVREGRGSDRVPCKIHVWEWDTGHKIAVLDGHEGGVGKLAFIPDGTALVSGGADGHLRKWNVLTGSEMEQWPCDSQRVNDFLFLPHRVLVAGSDGLSLLDVHTGSVLRRFNTGSVEAMCVAISPEAILCVAGMRNGSLLAWEMHTGREIRLTSMAHRGGVTSVVFSRSGEMVISGGMDSCFRFTPLNTRVSYEEQLSSATAARMRARTARDPKAWQTLANWFAVRGAVEWAFLCYQELQALGAKFSHLHAASVCWQAERLEDARKQYLLAGAAAEAPANYLSWCLAAVEADIARAQRHQEFRKLQDSFTLKQDPREIILQPGPNDSQDIWTTSVLSCDLGEDRPGGGRADEQLRVGGWADEYDSLLRFDLTELPKRADKATLRLFPIEIKNSGVQMLLERPLTSWNWKTQGTGRDRERLWWQDKPPAEPINSAGLLPPPQEHVWYEIDLTEIYNAWQNGTFVNHGIMLRPTSTVNGQFNTFSSSRCTTNYLRPHLAIIPR